MSKEHDPVKTLAVGREYLQELVLYILFYEKKLWRFALDESTSLRFIYGLSRFNENLHLTMLGKGDSSFENILKKSLRAMGYRVLIRQDLKRNIKLSFSGIGPAESGNKISFSILFEKSRGFRRKETHFLWREFPVRLFSMELPFILAKKAGKILSKTADVRDFYDVYWIQKRYPETEPLMEIILNYVGESRNLAEEVVKNGWKYALKERSKYITQNRVIKELLPFLLKEEEAFSFSRETFLEALGN